MSSAIQLSVIKTVGIILTPWMIGFWNWMVANGLGVFELPSGATSKNLIYIFLIPSLLTVSNSVLSGFHVVFHQYADGCGSGTGSMSWLQATIDAINIMNIKQLYFFIFVGVIHYNINELLMEKLRGEIIFAVPDKNLIFTPK
jgi:hypothetical protein